MKSLTYKLVLDKLERYCEGELWRGYDPYDGLNSPLFQIIPLKRKPVFRLAWSYIVRNLPFNLRPLLLIEKEHNPKALALFVSSYSQLFRFYKKREYLARAKFLATILESGKIESFGGPSWGYNFPWQSKVLYAPKGIPNAICTTFAGQAFLDLQEVMGSDRYSVTVRGICDFILNDLNRLETPQGICFSYTPSDKVWVHNVNLWISAFLARVWSLLEDDVLLNLAQRAVEFTISQQNSDGSWFYGIGNEHLLYIDNYHTGFNIVALKEFIRHSGQTEYERALYKGYEYYTKSFFLSSGAPRYYHDRLFPIDIHCCAQGIITHTIMGDLEKAERIAEWTLENMFDQKRGFFYYRKLPAYTVKIPFIRWSEAWMFYALTTIITKFGKPSQ